VSVKVNILKNFKKDKITINGNEYFALVSSKDDVVDGYVLELTDEELKKVDVYETSAYRRVEVTVGNDSKAFTYVKA